MVLLTGDSGDRYVVGVIQRKEETMRIISQDGMDDIPYADTWFTLRQVEDHYEIQAEAKDGEMYLVAEYQDEKQAKTVFHGMYRHYLQDKKYYQLPREVNKCDTRNIMPESRS